MALRLQVITLGPEGAPFYNSFYSQDNGSVGATELSERVNDLLDSCKGLFAGVTQMTQDGFTEAFDPATGQTQAVFNTGSWVVGGTGGANSLPRGVCAIWQWRTGLYRNGREVRGRSFMSGLAPITTTTGDMSATANATMNNNVNGYAAGFAQAALWSRTAGAMFNLSAGSVPYEFGLVRSRRDT